MTVRLTLLSIAILIAVAALHAPGGCKRQPDTLDRCVALAATNRPGAAAALLAAWNAGEITFEDALNRAHDLLEKGEDASGFAGAVLDFGVAIQSRFNTSGEMEIFWFRLGRLAFRGALAAFQRGRVEEARSIVLAGPKRWQTEGYWLRYRDHDALTSIILDASGETMEAISRLRDRTHLEGDTEETLHALEQRRR